MKVYNETSLASFRFWGSAVENAAMLSIEELDQIEFIFEDIYPDGMDEVTINDVFRFDFGWVCECLGYRYDEENDVIDRDPDDDDDDD